MSRMADGVGSKRKQLLFADEAVAHPPELSATGRDMKKEAATIGQLAGFARGAGLGAAAGGIGQGHVVPSCGYRVV